MIDILPPPINFSSASISPLRSSLSLFSQSRWLLPILLPAKVSESAMEKQYSSGRSTLTLGKINHFHFACFLGLHLSCESYCFLLVHIVLTFHMLPGGLKTKGIIQEKRIARNLAMIVPKNAFLMISFLIFCACEFFALSALHMLGCPLTK